MIFEFTVIYGIEFKYLNRTPLIFASKEGHLNIVSILLVQQGIDVNCRDILILKHL